MKIENDTIYVSKEDVETFFQTLRQSMSAFMQRETGGPEPELPVWVRRVHKHLDEHVFLYLKEAATETGYRNSYKAGYIIGSLRWSQDQLIWQMKNLQRLAHPKNVKIVSEVPEEELMQRFERSLSRIFFCGDASEQEEMLKGFLRSIRKMYLHAPINEAAEFFAGLADGFKGLDMRGSLYGRGTSITPIMITLLIWWPRVQEMKNIPQLHRWLCIMDGKAKVGGLKRVEKICERIGLTLKTPGRPRVTRKRKTR